MKFFLNNVDEHVGGLGAPDLRLDRVIVAIAQKLIAAQVLLVPFEEQLDLPAASLKSCNGLIAEDAAAPVHLGRVHAPGVHVAFGAGYKEGAGLMHLKQASKVVVASLHHVERTRLQDQDVQHIDLVHLAIADVDKGRNRASEVQQGVQLDGCLGFVKRRPVEQTQAQIYGGGIQCVDRVLEIEPQVLVQIKLASARDQNCSQVGPDSTVARLVGIGQGGEVNAVAKSHGVQLARVGSKRHFDVAQTLSPSQLSKSRDAKLLRASQAPHARVAAIARYDARKACPWSELHDLREQGLADIHRKSPRGLNLGNYTGMKKRDLKRHQIKLAVRSCQYWRSLQSSLV